MGEALDETKMTGRVLVVDDDPQVARLHEKLLARAGHEVLCASDGQEALDRLREHTVDVILADINMPRLDGIRMLQAVRGLDLDVVVLLVTGAPSVESAAKAVEHGALRYLVKPIEPDRLLEEVANALRYRRLAEEKRRTLALLGTEWRQLGDRASLQERFRRALDGLWVALQPILDARSGAVVGYEALVRTSEPTIPTPGAFLDAAERLGALHAVGRAVRANVAKIADDGPADLRFFVNLHPLDLMDEALYSPNEPLSKLAGRVVLEVTERMSLEAVVDVPRRVSRLRKLGYRIAIDDLGAGYAGLSGFALLEPDIVKLDLSLIRDLDRALIKRRIVSSMTRLCHELGLMVVGEGVETPEERDAAVELGADYLQGHLFSWPGPPFPTVNWQGSGQRQLSRQTAP